ncbi:MAG: hypothetical protein INH12_16315 [Cupriavidus sp.]|uniref:hypothetical protein n=1 Tax=Cupriavidus sp. EM10 TaxID=2839983 RepID=UPI001C0017BB|nr:hypothetical protein [Cupriavidus sp.]MCA3191638.1 hypothetical protein [Cupriavidus sp.]MCA3200121.1 hypothetical protein [Cupriavidus sp.]MCA3206354.1 hypothetical protein [Cupriavidus sp.]QWE97107.1 hypothetical protein KLP38_18305 [Cupriavidus sp. EM10]
MVVDTSDRVQYREVTVGPEIDGLRVIVKGLAANERIVVNGLQRVRPKDAVKAKTVEMAVGTAETKRPA